MQIISYFNMLYLFQTRIFIIITYLLIWYLIHLFIYFYIRIVNISNYLFVYIEFNSPYKDIILILYISINRY